MIDYVVYGKIIIDAIRLLDGSIVRNMLGGGGPQGAFGARVWANSVGILTRSGTDIQPEAVETLHGLDIDLQGWVQYEHIPTPHGLMEYDENEYMKSATRQEEAMRQLHNSLSTILAQRLPIPSDYSRPQAIHLITEYAHEPMVEDALKLKDQGALLSLEPIIDYRNWSNREEIKKLIRVANTATPDWPSASGIAGSDDPLEVVKYWSTLGPDLIAIRHGAKGSYAWDREHDQIWHIPAAKVKAVDPTGAGNSYGGGMCVGWAKTHDALLAGCYGTISASFVVREAGIPHWQPELREEAKKLLEKLASMVKKM